MIRNHLLKILEHKFGATNSVNPVNPLPLPIDIPNFKC